MPLASGRCLRTSAQFWVGKAEKCIVATLMRTSKISTALCSVPVTADSPQLEYGDQSQRLPAASTDFDRKLDSFNDVCVRSLHILRTHSVLTLHAEALVLAQSTSS
jgi:hypothetical protein